MHRIYLAPFQGITGKTYREVYSKYFRGVDKLYTPFFTGIHSPDQLSGRRSEELGKPIINGIGTVPQILSKDANEILNFASVCHKNGFTEINWNLGCPYARVANKKRGSGLLPYPEVVNEILEQVFSSISLPLSIKCRLGYFSPDEIIKLAKVFNQYNIIELTIHARIGKQLYKGKINLDVFEEVRGILNMPVVYNGDIFSKKDLDFFRERFPKQERWMIGRGLLVDPFLPELIKGTEVTDHKKRVRQFINDLYLSYRKKMNDRLQAISVMKELWGFMAFSFSEPQQAFNRVKKSRTFNEYEESVSAIFKQHEWLGSEAELFVKYLEI